MSRRRKGYWDLETGQFVYHDSRRYDVELARRYSAAVEVEDLDRAVEIGYHLGYSFFNTKLKVENQKRRNEQRRIQMREERRLAIAQRYRVPVSWVRLADELPRKERQVTQVTTVGISATCHGFIARLQTNVANGLQRLAGLLRPPLATGR